MRPRLFGFSAAILISGCSSQSENTGSSVQALQNATLDSTHTYAVGVVNAQMNTLCSGTLIGPNLVLTARHCVSASPGIIDCTTVTFGADSPANQLWVSTCDDVLTAACKTWFLGKKITVPSNSAFCGQDIALIELTSNVPQGVAQPVAVELQAIADETNIGNAFTAIGYGKGSFGSTGGASGLRRILQNIGIGCIPGHPNPAYDCSLISGWPYPPEELLGGGGICPGDSGSSAFGQVTFTANAPRAIGIVSRAAKDSSDNCISSIYTRTDSHAALIRTAVQSAATAGGYPVPAWALVTDAGVPPADASAEAGVADAANESSAPPVDAAPKSDASVDPETGSPADAGSPDILVADADVDSSADATPPENDASGEMQPDASTDSRDAAASTRDALPPGLQRPPETSGEGSMPVEQVEANPLHHSSGCGVAVSSPPGPRWLVAIGLVAAAGLRRRKERTAATSRP